MHPKILSWKSCNFWCFFTRTRSEKMNQNFFDSDNSTCSSILSKQQPLLLLFLQPPFLQHHSEDKQNNFVQFSTYFQKIYKFFWFFDYLSSGRKYENYSNLGKFSLPQRFNQCFSNIFLMEPYRRDLWSEERIPKNLNFSLWSCWFEEICNNSLDTFFELFSFFSSLCALHFQINFFRGPKRKTTYLFLANTCKDVI